MVNNLQIAFDRATKKYLDNGSSDDEEQVLLEYPPIVPANKSKTNKTVPSAKESGNKKGQKSAKSELIHEKKSTIVVEKKGSKRKAEKSEEEIVSAVKKKRKIDKKSSENSKINNSKSDEDKITQNSNSNNNDNKKMIDHDQASDKKSKKSKQHVLKEVKKNKKQKVIHADDTLESNILVGTKKNKIKNKKKAIEKAHKTIKHKKSKMKKVEVIKAQFDLSSEEEEVEDEEEEEEESVPDLISEDTDKLFDKLKYMSDDDKVVDKHAKGKESNKMNKHSKNSNNMNSGESKRGRKSAKQNKNNSNNATNNSNNNNNNNNNNLQKVQKKQSAHNNANLQSHNKKDKFDLIKERRQEKNSRADTDECKNDADEIPAPNSNNKGASKKKLKKEKPVKENRMKKSAKKSKTKAIDDDNQSPLNWINSKNNIENVHKKNNEKASLDVLDLETEQTLKDINKWLEHTPRFEYCSESNSPTRFTIEMEMSPKSSPLIKNDSDNHHNQKASGTSTTTSPIFSPKRDLSSPKKQQTDAEGAKKDAQQLLKKAAKEQKKKLLKEKMNLVKKREIQKTISQRLQPGKTKGNLLINIAKTNDESKTNVLLSGCEKVKEFKNALQQDIDDGDGKGSIKLNLGKVLDDNTFNFSKSEKTEENATKEPNNTNDVFSSSNFSRERKSSTLVIKNADEQSPENLAASSAADLNSSCVEIDTEAQEKDNIKKEEHERLTTPIETSMPAVKPNLNAWFKAFGVTEKKKVESASSAKSNNNNNTKTTNESHAISHRRISTGSSISEKSSVDSPLIEEAPLALVASPIATSSDIIPMSTIESNDLRKKLDYVENNATSSTRVGFYQDTVSLKSSPEKSCSPHESASATNSPSPYQNFNQQDSVYSSPGSNHIQNAHLYSNFYKPDSPSNTTPLNQAASYNNQQQQPASSFQTTGSSSPYLASNKPQNISSPTNSVHSSSSNNSYQSNHPSPYNAQSTQQQQQQQPVAQTSASVQNQNFGSQFVSSASSTAYEQQQQTNLSQFSPNSQTRPQNAAHQKQQQLNSYSGNVLHHTPPIPYNEHSNFMLSNKSDEHHASSHHKQKHQLHQQQQHQIHQQTNYNSAEINNSKSLNEPLNYLDLSKHTSTASSLSQQHDNKCLQQKTNAAFPPAPNHHSHHSHHHPHHHHYVDTGIKSDAATALSLPLAHETLHGKKMMSGSSNKESSKECLMDLNQSLQSEARATSLTPQSVLRSTPEPLSSTPAHIDMAYKQSSLFNTNQTPSMMELNSFMRDFRQQADERFSNASNVSSSNYYEKTHLYGKNIHHQSHSVTNLQQMFANPMAAAYGRDQKDLSSYHQNSLYQSQIGSSSSSINQQMPPLNSSSSSSLNSGEAKAKKPRKKKGSEITTSSSSSSSVSAIGVSNQQMPNTISHHQALQANHQQSQYVQQSTPFQSAFPALKIPPTNASPAPGDSLGIKPVVPGSAFNYGPSHLTGIYSENSAYLEDYRNSQSSYYSSTLRPPTEHIDKTMQNPPQAHPSTPPYHHLLPSHHPRPYAFMNSLDPAALQQQYRMMFNQTYYGMHNQSTHWHM
jgi:hypothetical protein